VSDRIFISYRRGEDSGFAQALYIRLEQEFSRDRLFMDVDSIAPGTDFVRHLESQVAQCDVLLALIGGAWVDATDGDGRRLDDASDFVRIEISSALRLDKRVIPVLLNDTKMPGGERLPEDLRPLVHRQAVRVTHERFRADTEGLIRALQGSRATATPVANPAPEEVQPVSVGSLSALASAPARPQTPPKALNIAGKIERAAARYEATNIGVVAVLSAVLLVFCSYLTGVLDVKYEITHKQVGFLWAPNWSINYLILCPFSCVCSASW